MKETLLWMLFPGYVQHAGSVKKEVAKTMWEVIKVNP